MEPVSEPEGLLGFELAGPGARLGARLIDFVLFLVAAVVLVVAAVGIGLVDIDLDETTGPSGSTLAATLLPLVAGGLYEVGLVAVRGQTLGKMALNIKVITTNGDDPPGWGPAAIRWAVPTLPGLVLAVIGSIIALVIYLWLLLDANRQGLHDKAANTYVVKVKGPVV